jgi:PAS domain S-box-containing protein
VLRLSDDAILVWAPGGEIEAWNPGATSLYGYTEDEARGRISSELLRSKAEVPWSAVEATLAASGHWEGELRQTARDGRELVVLAKLKVVVGVDGSRRVLESNRDITSRKLGEQALRQSELRFRSFFETPAVGTAELSLDGGRFVAVNDRYCEITGFSRDELLRMGPADLEPPEQAGHDVERLADYLEGHAGLYHHTKRYRRKDGTDVWVQVDAAVVRDDQGRPVRSAGVIVDVTDRVRAELGSQEALAASEKATAELDAIVQAIPHAVYFGTATGITRCNAEALHMLGASSLADLQARIGGVAERCRVRYRRDGGPVAPEDLPFSRALAGEKATLDTWATRADSGEDVLIRGNSAPVSVDGKTIGAVAVDIDVTQYHELQDRLRERERYFHELFEACPSGLVVLEPDARIVEFNERAHLQLGYTREEFARLELHQIDVNESAATLEARIARILREGADVFEARHRAKSGEIRDVIVEVRCTEQSGRKRLLSVWRDITERKQAERALLEADRNKDEFIAVLSHELRNPLGPITNSLFVLDRAAPTSEPATRARAAIRRQVAHMTRLVNDLLDVTRIARGRIQLNRERTDLRETVGRTVDDFRAGFETAGISLDVETDGEALLVDGDPTRLAQVFGNLLHNANKFTPREGRVRISVGRDRTRNEAVVVFADDGAGISPELLPRLFTPFCQADHSLDRSHGGLGLGLSLVKGLVDLHGGSVAVRSDGPARGSEFRVRLPLLGEGGLARDGAPASRSRVACRALVIEDNTDAAESLRDALELLGHEVAVAYTGAEGIEVARSFQPDVVLCDIGLPVMNGYAVAREFRSDGALRRAFLVALSGYSMPEDVRRAMEAGFDLHLAKPPDLGRLEAVLGEAASRPIGDGVRG